MWYTYIVRCRDGSLYTGVTNGLQSRIDRHNDGSGAKYTRAKRPVKLVYAEKFDTKSKAQIREAEVKKFKRKEKVHLVKFGAGERFAGVVQW